MEQPDWDHAAATLASRLFCMLKIYKFIRPPTAPPYCGEDGVDWTLSQQQRCHFPFQRTLLNAITVIETLTGAPTSVAPALPDLPNMFLTGVETGAGIQRRLQAGIQSQQEEEEKKEPVPGAYININNNAAAPTPPPHVSAQPMQPPPTMGDMMEFMDRIDIDEPEDRQGVRRQAAIGNGCQKESHETSDPSLKGAAA